MKTPLLIAATLAAALFTCASANAQAVTGTVLGTVTDASGAIVVAARVTLSEVNTGVSRSNTTNDSGNYTFPDVPQGSYSLTVELNGFRREIRQNVDVAVNTSARVDFQLQPGSLNQTVEVTTAPPPLQTDRADTSVSLSQVQTANLPVSTNRNFQGLLNLVPGTTRASFQHSNFFNAQSALQTQTNGQLRMGNNYQIEGIDDNERTGLLQILIPPIEAIQTVDASTSNFEAELGRASGAVVNVILKSGTNQIHGAAYEFHQNSEFNARSFFNPGVGHQVYNYFGGNVGGPILKNKLFYFGDILRTADHQANANLLTIPTVNQRAGNLGSGSPIFDPGTGNADGTGRQQFNGNQIPLNRINPVSARLLALIPLPNQNSPSGNNNFFALLPYHKDTTSYDIKLDYVPTEKDRVSGRLSFQRPNVFQAPAFGLAGGPAQSAFAGTGIQRTYSGGINYSHIFSPSLVAELRTGVAYYNNIATQTDYGSNASANIGIPGINVDQVTSGLVGIDLGSFYSSPILGYSASLPWVRAETNIDVANIWTKIIGNHTLKFGGDLRRIRDALFQNQTFSARGLYTFAPGQTALNQGKGSSSATSYTNNLASFLLDLPSQAGRDLATYFPSLRGWQFFTFVQDKWVVSPKFTADLGLRWEFYPPYTPEHAGGFSNYNSTNNTLVVAGVGGNPSNLGIKTRYKYFAPRLGFAYRLRDTTVLRAGFGISYTPFPDNNYAFNYPVRANNQFLPAGSATGFTPAVLPSGQTASFQNGFPGAIVPVVPASGIIPGTASQQYNEVNRNFKNPYVETWNFAIQQALAAHFILDLAYVANHGVDSVVNYNANAGIIAGAGQNGQPQYQAFRRTANTNVYFVPFSTSYQSLQVKLDRRFSNLNITTAYTWGKGLSFQDGDDGGLYFYINQHRNYGRNNFDRKHTFVQSYVYDLPFGPGQRFLQSGRFASIFGGWRLSGVLSVMSGLPINVTAAGTALNAPGNTQTADQVAPVTILGGIGPNSPWFSPASFRQPTAPGVFGNTGRNIFDGPGFFNLDASLNKLVRLTERFNVEVKGEAFGITNTPQFANPNSNVQNAGNFGYVTGTLANSNGGGSTGGGRVLQLGARFNF